MRLAVATLALCSSALAFRASSARAFQAAPRFPGLLRELNRAGFGFAPAGNQSLADYMMLGDGVASVRRLSNAFAQTDSGRRLSNSLGSVKRLSVRYSARFIRKFE